MKKKPHDKNQHVFVQSTTTLWKPTKTQLLGAYGKRISDIIAPNLKILFVGINPGLYSGAVGHHFARPGNRFWPALHKSGFTQKQLSPFEGRELLKHGYGITNVVNKTTATAAELDQNELKAGGQLLVKKIKRYCPCIVAVLGLNAFRVAFGQPKAHFGPQKQRIGSTQLWILPNPSGLNARYQLNDLIGFFRKLRIASGLRVLKCSEDKQGLL
ncbi:MAG: G/U mismatch-specific DNA glycosylase [Nitrospirota bacterium]